MEEFIKYMKICETLAQSAASKGNSPVGSLIVLNGEIVAESEEAVATKQDVSCHAEMEVIRKARKVIGMDFTGAILVSTKEPCVMCSYAIRYHKISTMVYKEKASALGGVTSAYDLLVSEQVPEGWGPPVKCILIENHS